MDNDELARALGRIEGHQEASAKSLVKIDSHLAKLNNRTASLESFRSRLKGATALGVVFLGVGVTLMATWLKRL